MHSDKHFEYFIGDPSYQGRDQYIVQRLGCQEQSLLVDNDVVNTYNKMPTSFRIRVEWGIGGLKCKLKRLLKRFDSTKSKYIPLFKVVCYLTNYLHQQRLDFTIHVRERNDDEDDDGWDGDL